jgi:hypothetical protein
VTILANLTKAAIAAAVSPVALIADVLTLPASSMDPHRGPFERTAGILNTAGACVVQAIKPQQDLQP